MTITCSCESIIINNLSSTNTKKNVNKNKSDSFFTDQ